MATIMTLVDSGKLSLDTKISDVYPEYFNRTDTQNITLRQCMSHTSGFQSNF
jgi:CubicO group peptidase (beta-lactamase class C family)